MSITKERESRYLTHIQMADQIDAADFAQWQDTPYTRALTFNLKGLDGRPQDFISDFFKLSGDWLRSRGAPRVSCWVLEHPPTKSLNAHLLAHVPSRLMGEYANKQRGWMKEAGYPWKPGRLKSEKICDEHNKSRGPQSIGELLANIERTLGYMLKGGEPDACAALRLDDVWQGSVRGKRCGVSQSISKAARDAAGYHSPPSERYAILFRDRHRLSKIASRRPIERGQ